MNEVVEKDETSGALVAMPSGTSLVSLFVEPTQVDDMLNRIEAEARSHAPDLTTLKGRKAIASLANKVARSKTALDNAGKKLTDDARKQVDAVNEERRKIRDRLDGLKVEVRKPLTDWEEKEAERVEKLQSDIAKMSPDRVPVDATSDDIAKVISIIENISINEEAWQEFTAQAAEEKDASLATLRVRLDARLQREAERAELERLRAEAEEQKREAEAEEQKRAAAQEAERIEREKKEAAERAVKEAEERAEREAQELKERHERELFEAKAAEEAAREDERQKAEQRERDAQAERDAELAADEARRKDEEHRRAIFEDIQKAILDMPRERIAKAILNGEIPHVEVKF